MTVLNSAKMFLMISTITQFCKVLFVFDFFNPCLDAMNGTALIAIRALFSVFCFDQTCAIQHLCFITKKNYGLK